MNDRIDPERLAQMRAYGRPFGQTAADSASRARAAYGRRAAWHALAADLAAENDLAGALEAHTRASAILRRAAEAER